MSNFDLIETGGAPVKAWIRGVPLEDAARRQLCQVAQLLTWWLCWVTTMDAAACTSR